MIKFKDFFKEYSELLAVILGIAIFFNFSSASNPAVHSFLWLFSSIIIIALLIYVSASAFIYGTNSVRFFIGLPLTLMGLVITLQTLLSLFEPTNIYSLTLVEEIFSFSFLNYLLTVIIDAILLVVIVCVLKRNSNSSG